MAAVQNYVRHFLSLSTYKDRRYPRGENRVNDFLRKQSQGLKTQGSQHRASQGGNLTDDK